MQETSTLPVSSNVTIEAPPLLVVENLRTEIQTARGVMNAVDGVSFTLSRGETLGIVGESGSGKSVLGRTVMGLYRTGGAMTVTGSVMLEGVDIQQLPEGQLREVWGRRVGMVFQDPMTALNPVKKIGTHLTETIRQHKKVSRTEASDKAAELLTLVGIPEPRRRLGQYPHELSGGMRQRVVIAMALANEPELLIADEPTTALDVTVQKQILDLLDELRIRLNMAVIIISHNLAVIAGRADRVAVMYAGRFAEVGTSGDVFQGRHHPYTNALLGSVPRLASSPHTQLPAIQGAPPDMTNPPAGCRFAPRCAFARPACELSLPELELVISGRAPTDTACFYPLNNEEV